MYIGASKAYSYRGIRLKKFPVIGYLTVIIFQGALTFWIVYYGSNMDNTFFMPWQGMAICTLLIGGVLSVNTDISASARPGRWRRKLSATGSAITAPLFFAPWCMHWPGH
ncbi:MAG: hypothetical protein WDO71_05315 [Bacteroidota bacterium]